MRDSELEEQSGGRGQESEAFGPQSGVVAEVLQELINLLEQYAPVWYTEEHHKRAMTALRVLEESRQPGKGEAARSQRAG